MKNVLRTVTFGASTSRCDNNLIKARAVAVYDDGELICNAVVVSSWDIAIPTMCLSISFTQLSDYEARLLHPEKNTEIIGYKLGHLVMRIGVSGSISIIRVSSTTVNSRYLYIGK